MTREEAAYVLAYAAAADPRLNTPDAEQAQARIIAWADLLDVVPAEFALDRVRRHYRHAEVWPVSPGVIRAAWVTEQARLHPPALTTGGVPAPDVPARTRALLDEARQACREASALRGAV